MVCGRLLVIATLVPTSAFISVDLPTFGRPAKQAKPRSEPRSPGAALVSLACGVHLVILPYRAAPAYAGAPRRPGCRGPGRPGRRGTASQAGSVPRTRAVRSGVMNTRARADVLDRAEVLRVGPWTVADQRGRLQAAAPLDTAIATASARADRRSEGSATAAAA